MLKASGLLTLRAKKTKVLLFSESQLAKASDEILSWKECGIESISLKESEYPEALRSLSVPPPIIFLRGQLPSKPALAIVGTRKAERQSLLWVEEVAEALAAQENCIVSGLAYGIDSAAHRGALKSEVPGSTVAVLGGGLLSIYPKNHERLAEEIFENGGGLLSMHEPSSPPLPHYFLERNQLISGLCLGTMVVQAAARSGSISTASAALDQGRELLAVPGSIFNTLSEGSNRLLKCGAHLVLTIDDIFEAIPELNRRRVNRPIAQELSPDERTALKLIGENDKLHLNDLIEKLSLSPQAATSIVSALELSGQVTIDHFDYIFRVKVG